MANLKVGVMDDVEAKASSCIEVGSNCQPNKQNKILEQLMPALVATQQNQKQVLQFLMLRWKPNILLEKTIIDDPMQGVTRQEMLNLSAAGSWPASKVDEPVVFMTIIGWWSNVKEWEGEGICIHD